MLWAESDSEQPRPPLPPTSQRPPNDYGTAQSSDRTHRPPRRATDALGKLPASSASRPHILSLNRETYATGPPLYSTTNTSHPPMAAVAASSSSRVRTHDFGKDTYDLRTYLKTKATDRRSPRSSEERLYPLESGKQARSSTQARTGYPTTTQTPQGTAQSYYAPNIQTLRDPVIPQRDRDREKAEARERKRVEKEAARLRIEEEKARVRAQERTRERERDRLREEKELRRAERAREVEKERRREEKEQERARRYKEKERSKEPSRGRDGNPVYPHQSASAQISAAAGALKHYAESKLSVSRVSILACSLLLMLWADPSSDHRPNPLLKLQPCSAAVRCSCTAWCQHNTGVCHD